ncbi:MAG: ABC transporter permease [Acidimicrobiaceae bacterium]|nr:ABC transporter permease [Acidimicrobiaceae bacterium]
MNDVLEALINVGVLASAIRIATPLLLAALGEMVTERAGILNLGIEGTITVSAFGSFVVADKADSLWLGVVSGVGAGILLSLLMAVLVSSIKVEQVVAGLALNLFGIGMAFYLFRAVYPQTGSEMPRSDTFDHAEIPLLSAIPAVGEVVFSQHWLTYAAIGCCPLLWWTLNRTQFGLELRSVGNNPAACDMRGINVTGMQYLALMFGGLMAGLAGAFLSVFLSGLFFVDVAAGRGWIALAIVIFGNWRIGRILAGSLFFGYLDAYQLSLQARGVDVPHQLLLALPFALTIAALVVNRRRSHEPLHLGVPYFRGER